MISVFRVVVCTGMLLLPWAAETLAETHFICSVIESLECSEGEECGLPDFSGVTPPTFLHLDIEKKVITLLAPAERRGEQTVIDVAEEVTGGWILAGVESERAWNIYLTDEGNMTVSVTMDGTTWTAFGRCMPAADARP